MMTESIQERKDRAYADGFRDGFRDAGKKVRKLKSELAALEATAEKKFQAELEKERAEIADIKERIAQLQPETNTE